IQMRDADLALVAAEQEDFRLSISIPIGDRQIADTSQSRKDFRGSQRAILLLQEEGNLAAFRLGHQQIRQAITVHIRPEQTAPRLISLVERQKLKLSLDETT